MKLGMKPIQFQPKKLKDKNNNNENIVCIIYFCEL